MSHSSNDLRYRVVLVSESTSPPEPSSPIPTEEIAAPSPAPADGLFAYTAVPVEETYTPPKKDDAAAPHAPGTAAARYAEPIYEVLPVAEPIGGRRPGGRRGPIRYRRRKKLPWTLEKHGLESMAYLFREPGLMAWLLGGLGLGTAIGSALFLLLVSSEPENMAFLFLWGGFPLYVLCFLGGFWNCVLTSAIRGEAGVVRWPGFNIPLILRGCWRCLWCFLAGPIVPLAAGFYFWLYAGDLTTLDWWIMAELVFVSANYWLLSFLAVADKDSVWQATPANAFRMIRQLGWHSILAALLMFTWTVIHGLWGLDALRELHRFIGSGWFWLWFCSISAVFWMTCLLRWLGVRTFRNRNKDAAVTQAAALWTPQLPPASV